MNMLKMLKTAAVFMALAVETVTFACPEYASEETKRVIGKMVEAHGGLEHWRNAPSIRFDDLMHMETHDRQQFGWWVAHEVIDQETRQVWQDWPLNDARLGFDGDTVWSENWRPGNNPPGFMVHFFYYFVNLPWLTQDDGVRLSAVSRFEWPGIDEPLYEVRMTFDGAPSVGKSNRDFFVLYIHPETWRLTGYQYGIGYAPLTAAMGMPDGSVFGPMWRLITHYEVVDGLVFPTAFHTMPEPGGRILGDHVILNIDVATPFEKDKAAVPPGADVYEGPLTTVLDEG